MAIVKLDKQAPLGLNYSFDKTDQRALPTRLLLIPGVNDLDEEQMKVFEACKKHDPEVQRLIAEGVIKELDLGSKDGKDKMPASLEKLDTRTAIELVDGTVDKDRLQGWLKGEKRQNVAQLIKKQMADIDLFDERKRKALEEARV